MKKEDFFEVLGEFDDDILEGAKAPMKKQLDWKVWGTAVACLVLVCALAICFTPLHHGGEVTSPGVADAAPMVYVNGTLYQQSVDQRSYSEQKAEFIYLGKILSDVTNEQSGGTDGVPKEEFQANHPVVGCAVYQYGENIVVQIDQAYWLYMKYDEPKVNWDDLTEQEKQKLDPAYKG